MLLKNIDVLKVVGLISKAKHDGAVPKMFYTLTTAFLLHHFRADLVSG